VTAANNTGLWLKQNGSPLAPRLLLRTGDVIDRSTAKTIVAFQAGNGSSGQGRGWVTPLYEPGNDGTTLLTGAQVMALVMLENGGEAIVRASPLGDDARRITILSETGFTGPGRPSIEGATFKSYGMPAHRPGHAVAEPEGGLSGAAGRRRADCQAGSIFERGGPGEWARRARGAG
jgi:hypothetical protein